MNIDMSSTQKVLCPICNKTFCSSKINDHVERCLNASEKESVQDDTDPPAKKRKCSTAGSSGWGFLMSKEKSRCGQVNAYKGKIDNKSNTKGSAAIKSDGDCIKLDISSDDDTLSSAEHVKSSTALPLTSSTAGSCEPSKDRGTHLHSRSVDFSVPLADQMRPESFENFVGQEKALGRDNILWSLLHSDTIPSMILWGPPGCGKTTLAKIVARKCKEKMRFVQLSATSSGVNDVKDVVKKAKNDFKMFHKRTVLFLDEIHRFNKLQQDSLLPHVEDGTITLIGATTENPSFQVNSALLSRSRVVVLEKHSKASIFNILRRAVEKLNIKVIEESEQNVENKLDGICVESSALNFLSAVCDGDARSALNGLQMSVQSAMAKSLQTGSVHERCGENPDEAEHSDKNNILHAVFITTEHVKMGLQRSHVAYDKTGEEHYNMISALHKSMRGSCDSAALYWLARMMEGGEEPLYIARRLIEFASEDVGLADPQALILAVSTYQACHFIGKPECEKPLAECVVYLSRAPKSIEAVSAYLRAKACIHDQDGPLPPVPLHLRNASTKLMSSLGYAKGYKYNPSFKQPVRQEYFPEELIGTNFFD